MVLNCSTGGSTRCTPEAMAKIEKSMRIEVSLARKHACKDPSLPDIGSTALNSIPMYSPRLGDSTERPTPSHSAPTRGSFKVSKLQKATRICLSCHSTSKQRGSHAQSIHSRPRTAPQNHQHVLGSAERSKLIRLSETIVEVVARSLHLL